MIQKPLMMRAIQHRMIFFHPELLHRFPRVDNNYSLVAKRHLEDAMLQVLRPFGVDGGIILLESPTEVWKVPYERSCSRSSWDFRYAGEVGMICFTLGDVRRGEKARGRGGLTMMRAMRDRTPTAYMPMCAASGFSQDSNNLSIVTVSILYTWTVIPKQGFKFSLEFGGCLGIIAGSQ
jgi:hypothetical protein